MPLEKDLKGEKWTFDGDVTTHFDDMLRRSIPDHDRMRQLCFDVGCRFVKPSTGIVDLGCSRGEALAPFVDKFGAFNTYHGVEASEPMRDAARARFAGMIQSNLMKLHAKDLRSWYPPYNVSLTLAVLTLQFIPITYRQRLIQHAWNHTAAGGGLIVVEKVLGSDAYCDDAMVELYHAEKLRNGYTQDEIDRKALSLEGVLVPVSIAENERMIRAAGFQHVECFWRSLSFCAWFAVKV